jgi:hypothetical protein
MIVIAIAVFVGALFPEVESPWPERIGLDLPFSMAGGFGVAASLLRASAQPAARDKAVARAGQAGFGLGVVGYSLALVFQVISKL